MSHHGEHHIQNVSSAQAWQMLQHDHNAILVDVRTLPEWSFVGEADLRSLNKEPLRLSWKIYPNMQVNPHFPEQLQQMVADKTAPLLFLCKTGGRSYDAALAAQELGYTHCYNIADGFEGDINDAQHRGAISGWKATGCPWRQS